MDKGLPYLTLFSLVQSIVTDIASGLALKISNFSFFKPP